MIDKEKMVVDDLDDNLDNNVLLWIFGVIFMLLVSLVCIYYVGIFTEGEIKFATVVGLVLIAFGIGTANGSFGFCEKDTAVKLVSALIVTMSFSFLFMLILEARGEAIKGKIVKQLNLKNAGLKADELRIEYFNDEQIEKAIERFNNIHISQRNKEP